MTGRTATLVCAIFLISAFIAVSGCTREGGDSFNGFSSITFTPGGPGGPGVIRLELEQSDPGNKRFTLKLVGEGMNAYGVGGKLRFDTNLLTLKSGKEGDALQGEGFMVLSSLTPNPDGCVFGFSRSDKVQASTEMTKDKTIGTLEFTVNKTGSTPITFDTDRARVMTHKLEKLEPVKWVGGTLTVK